MKNMNIEWDRHIKEGEIASMASDLVKIPSYSHMDRQEEKVAAYILSLLAAEGIEAWLQEVEPGRPNVIARIVGEGGGRSLMLSGHMDTVPAYGMKDPFGGAVADGVIYGRGACDMKGALASMIAAVIGIKRAGVKLCGTLYFTGVIDEEEQGKGTAELIRKGPYADAVIVGEGTGLRVATGNKGLEWIEIIVHGKKVHGGAMEKGINAITQAAKLITRIENDYVPKLKERTHPLLGNATLNFGTIRGGDQPSTVPGSCVIQIDRRWLPSETVGQVYGELQEVIDGLRREDPRFNAKIQDMFSGKDLLVHKPFHTDESDGIVRSAQYCLERAGSLPTGPVPCPAWTDAGYMSNYTDSSCIILGPGDLSLAHSEEDMVLTSDLYKAALIYADIAVDYCGLAEEKDA